MNTVHQVKATRYKSEWSRKSLFKRQLNKKKVYSVIASIRPTRRYNKTGKLFGKYKMALIVANIGRNLNFIVTKRNLVEPRRPNYVHSFYASLRYWKLVVCHVFSASLHSLSMYSSKRSRSMDLDHVLLINTLTGLLQIHSSVFLPSNHSKRFQMQIVLIIFFSLFSSQESHTRRNQDKHRKRRNQDTTVGTRLDGECIFELCAKSDRFGLQQPTG